MADKRLWIRTLGQNSVQTGKEGGSRALLICPDARLAAELAGALATEQPATRLLAARAYPDRGAAASLAAAAQACFLDFATDQQAAQALMSWLSTEVPGCAIVVILRDNDPELVLRCLRGGATDFLIRPFTRAEVLPVLGKLDGLRRAAETQGGVLGRICCLMPAQGGCGATTIAANLAFALRRLSRSRVLLADLDGLAGTIGFILKLNSSYSYVDAVNHTGELEEDVWKALAMPCQGIDVLLAPENPVDSFNEAMDPSILLSSARHSYDAVVVDCGGAHGEWNSALARLADSLVLVTTNELPALHASQRALAALEQNGAGRPKAHVVLNRPRRLGLSEAEVSLALGAPVLLTVPPDTEALGEALMEGRPAPASSAFGKSISALARALSDSKPRQQKPSLISRVLGR